MRTTASALCLLVLGVFSPAIAADRIRIEIVEARTTIGLIPKASPGTPEQIRTHCDGRVDVNCVSTVTPATDPSVAMVPTALAYEANAILPDGSHAKLTCFPDRWNKKCKMIESTASRGEGVKCYMEALAAFGADHQNSNETKTCTTKNIGRYSAKRDKDEVVISTQNGKLEYRITGTW